MKTPAILDEVQHVPEVFAFVRSRIDRQPRRTGRWLLTGSPETPLIQGVTESMPDAPPRSRSFRTTLPHFHLLAKPTDAACDLGCKYCFILDQPMKTMATLPRHGRYADEIMQMSKDAASA